jgi:hypothetical protein
MGDGGDPLADLPEPPVPGNVIQNLPNAVNGVVTLNPGQYPNGIHVNNVKIHMNPGVYYMGGPNKPGGFDTKGITEGTGVLLFIKTGSLQFKTGSSAATLVPLNPTDFPQFAPASTTYEHITVFQARDNFSQATVQGFAPTVTGTFYFFELHKNGRPLAKTMWNKMRT